ncbi:MAG: CBS domain-containing protein, partial [Bacteroidota bacterium]
CGMALAGANQWLDAHRGELTEDDVVVVLLPDSGFRYLSKLYDDAWMQNHGFLERSAALDADQILSMSKTQRPGVISVTPTATLAEAIGEMAAQGISQIPVIEDERVVGSLTETVILNKLIAEPEARDQPVSEIMSAPFPVIPRTMHLEQLSGYLEQGPGAVLVHDAGDEHYQILTKSDLIDALMHVR